ncbi:unnamed protein product [Protopolystoma xenopodis]|uniref:Uncharacterized protein n=1 Tax=Protopolystoma xenopodis TaxID=117903 RepID=A0A3S5CMM5_9PLAT|nr:unnamed protein product [Protopolystoma xenopodis]
MTWPAVNASKPVVGSSRKRTVGSVINSIPILVRFLSPPDTPLINSVPICDKQCEIKQKHLVICKTEVFAVSTSHRYVTKMKPGDLIFPVPSSFQVGIANCTSRWNLDFISASLLAEFIHFSGTPLKYMIRHLFETPS